VARTRTLVQMREEARSRVDVEAATLWLTDATLTRMINQSIARLERKLADHDEDLVVKSTPGTVNTVAGTERYALPSDFYKLIGAPEVNLGNGPQQLKRWSWDERPSYLDASGWSPNAPVSYRLYGRDQISFLPIPSAVHAVTVHYVPTPTQLAADADFYDGRAGWEEWVIVDVAMKIEIKAERDIAELRAERDELWADITRSAKSLDQGAPDRVRETSNDYDGWP
jgi:hypothetical protein